MSKNDKTHASVSAPSTAKDAHVLTMSWLDCLPIATVLLICVGAFFYTRARKKKDDHKGKTYWRTTVLNIVALVIAAIAAKYPIANIEWLPDSQLPGLGDYAFRLVGWFLITLAVLRFIWTLTTLWDSDKLYLTGDPANEKDGVSKIAETVQKTDRALKDAELLLFDKQLRTALSQRKHRGYRWVLEMFLAVASQNAPEFAAVYATHVWDTPRVNGTVPDQYWKVVKDAIANRQPAVDGTTTAVYIRTERTVLVIEGKNGKPAKKEFIIGFIESFDTYWANL